jgi:hypothetical protein
VRTGFAAQLGKYAEAIELFWFQYVVGYDKQEQRSLATSLNTHLFNFGRFVSQLTARIKRSLPANLWLVVGLLLVLSASIPAFILMRRVRLLGWRRALSISSEKAAAEASRIIFYERLMALLAQRGLQRDGHLTPLEFAKTLQSGEALLITRAYNRVRFGRQRLSASEMREIERALLELEASDPR